MAVVKEFMDAVQADKLMRVRIMLKDSLLVDPTSTQFDEMANYAERKMGDIYVEHDGENLNYDVSYWNERYLNEQMVLSVNNFSRERINLLKSMVRALYMEKTDKIKNEQYELKATHSVNRKQLDVGAAVAGAALAAAGVCTSQTVLIIGGVVAVAVGAALIISDKGDE